MKRLFLCLCCAALAGCSADATDMIVHIVAGDSAFLNQIDHLSFSIRDVEAGQLEYQLPSTQLCQDGAPSGCLTLPADLVLYPGPQRPSDTVEVELQGLSGSQVRIDTAARFVFLARQSQSLTLALYTACVDRMPACAANPNAPYCEADGSCGQPSSAAGDGGAPSDLSPLFDLAARDLAPPDSAAPDLAVPDLLTPDLLTPDLLEPDLAPCTAPVGNEAYVDALAGVDDMMHGSGSGQCAFKTVTFALGHSAAQAVIHLAPGQTFSSGETFPISLSGQTLSCGAASTLYGSGPGSATTEYTVLLTAAGSTLDGCTLSPGFADPGCGAGSSTNYDAIHVTGSGTTMLPIVIHGCTLSHSSFTIGVFVDNGQHDLIISNDVIKGINDVQVGGSVTAQVTNNELDVGCGGTTFSVRCDSTNTVEIVGNNGGASLLCNGTCYQSSPPAGQQCP